MIINTNFNTLIKIIILIHIIFNILIKIIFSIMINMGCFSSISCSISYILPSILLSIYWYRSLTISSIYQYCNIDNMLTRGVSPCRSHSPASDRGTKAITDLLLSIAIAIICHLIFTITIFDPAIFTITILQLIFNITDLLPYLPLLIIWYLPLLIFCHFFFTDFRLSTMWYLQYWSSAIFTITDHLIFTITDHLPYSPWLIFWYSP